MEPASGRPAPLRLLLHMLYFPSDAEIDDPGGSRRCAAPAATSRSAEAARGAELASWLAGRGHLLHVIAAPAHDGLGGGTPGYGSWRWQAEAPGGARVTRCPVHAAPSSHGLGRGLHNASFALSSAPVLLHQATAFRPDLVAALAPSRAALPAVLAAARLAGAPAWLHLGEGDAAAATGFTALLRRGFDCVSLAAGDAEERLAALGIAPARRLALPAWVDTRAIFPSSEPSRLRAELRLEPDTIVALYAGSLDDESGIESLIEAARHVPQNGAVVFLLCGSGPARARLEAAAGGLPPLRLLPWPPAQRLNELLNLADIHLLPAGAGAVDRLLPAKLATLLASGRPILAGAAGGRLPPALHEAVVPAAPGTDRAEGRSLAAGIIALAAAPAERLRRGAAARRHAQDYFEKERVLRGLERGLRDRLDRGAATA